MFLLLEGIFFIYTSSGSGDVGVCFFCNGRILGVGEQRGSRGGRGFPCETMLEHGGIGIGQGAGISLRGPEGWGGMTCC